MKKVLLLLWMVSIFYITIAQEKPHPPISSLFYGINAWMPDSIGTGTPILGGKVHQLWDTIAESGAKMIRFGGIRPDSIKPTNYQYLYNDIVPAFSSNKTYIGVLAQDIQKIAPYCVQEGFLKIKQSDSQAFSDDIVETYPADSTGEAQVMVNTLTFNQDGLIYAMINSIRQLDSTNTELKHEIDSLKNPIQKRVGQSEIGQQAMIDSLAKQFSQLQSMVNNCCNSSTGNNTTGDNSNPKGNIEVDLANKNNVILYQNEPNPFTNQTIIRYFIPEALSPSERAGGEAVFVVFHDEFGKEVKKVEVTEKGFGKIEASTENLASGMYSYSIVADGKVVDTKKMMRTK